ncbi:MAG: response regulator [Deltaproteobacteria bacterium]|nr:response regulator [Deltaproteobacteria bacterium]
MAHEHILIVEDEKKIAELLRDYLVGAGFEVSWHDSGGQVVKLVRKSPPTLILLDIMLPDMDGKDICREIRKFSNIPIMMITAKAEEVDRLVGLELGADDYICKPFSPREVVARVKAVLRRIASPGKVPDNLVFGDLTVDESAHRASVGKEILDLTPSEFNLLKVLMTHPDRVFTRSELMDKVQGYQFEGYDRTIDTHIKNLRKKISEKLPDRKIIRTVYGVGYKLRFE